MQCKDTKKISAEKKYSADIFFALSRPPPSYPGATIFYHRRGWKENVKTMGRRREEDGHISILIISELQMLKFLTFFEAFFIFYNEKNLSFARSVFILYLCTSYLNGRIVVKK